MNHDLEWILTSRYISKSEIYKSEKNTIIGHFDYFTSRMLKIFTITPWLESLIFNYYCYY